MPHVLYEYKIVNNKITLINEAEWYERTNGTDTYYINGEMCSAQKFQGIYDTKDKYIEFVSNSRKNRTIYGVNSYSTNSNNNVIKDTSPKNIYGLIIGGICDDKNGSDYDRALMYTRLCNSTIKGYKTHSSDIHLSSQWKAPTD